MSGWLILSAKLEFSAAVLTLRLIDRLKGT